jgi:cytoskeletal protein CcmA (bactofilin family)
MARQVEAHGGVSVQGVLEANVVSEGAVEIGSRAEWKGDCRAPVIVVEAGARIAGGYFSVRGNGAG